MEWCSSFGSFSEDFTRNVNHFGLHYRLKHCGNLVSNGPGPFPECACKACKNLAMPSKRETKEAEKDKDVDDIMDTAQQSIDLVGGLVQLK
eukprot:2281770-Amphidinium_carterae.1